MHEIFSVDYLARFLYINSSNVELVLSLKWVCVEIFSLARLRVDYLSTVSLMKIAFHKTRDMAVRNLRKYCSQQLVALKVVSEYITVPRSKSVFTIMQSFLIHLHHFEKSDKSIALGDS